MYIYELAKRVSIYLCVWCLDKGVPLKQLHESYLNHQQSKPHPNTVTRSKTKWHVTELWSLGFLFWCKSMRGNKQIFVSKRYWRSQNLIAVRYSGIHYVTPFFVCLMHGPRIHIPIAWAWHLEMVVIEILCMFSSSPIGKCRQQSCYQVLSASSTLTSSLCYFRLAHNFFRGCLSLLLRPTAGLNNI